MNYLILNQLGTPQAPTAQAVGKYLQEFLMDGNVIPVQRPFRDVLVKLGIVPLRKSKSALKYKSIWTDDGSPLAVNTYNLQKKIQAKLDSNWKVVVGMRYGSPSIQNAIEQVTLAANDHIYFLPLYPHYAQATVYSSIEKLKQIVKNKKEIHVMEPFFEKDWFIQAQGQMIQKHLRQEQHLLLSYHGLPINQETHADISYQKQCLETSKLLKNFLNLSNDQISSAFQSRVGLKKWLEPSTDSTMKALVGKGVTNLAVACPSFMADCLETLEEIGIELKHNFLALGGTDFQLVPCLNDQDLFVQGVIGELHELHANKK